MNAPEREIKADGGAIEVRLARYDEVFMAEACLVEGYQEMDIPVPDYERPYSYQRMLDQIANGFVWVAVADGKVVGVIALHQEHWPWNRGHVYLINDHFYVAPGYRRGGTAKRLLDCAKNKVDDLGCLLMISLMGAGNREAKDKFIESCGMSYAGGQFFYQGVGDGRR